VVGYSVALSLMHLYGISAFYTGTRPRTRLTITSRKDSVAEGTQQVASAQDHRHTRSEEGRGPSKGGANR
jgi:hypothetical protein